MGAKFTDKYLRNLKPDPARYIYDDLLPGLGVYVGKRSKTFVVVRRGTRTKIGQYPSVTLSEARTRARFLLSGHIPEERISFRSAVSRYLALRQPDLALGTLRNYKRLLEAFRGQSRPVCELTQADILNHLDTIPGQSEKAHAARAFNTFFNWCVERQFMDRNPLATIKLPKEPPPRERVLSDEELKLLWHHLYPYATTKNRATYAALIRLLILTGQRTAQIAQLQPDWIDFGQNSITFPASIMKNRRQHTHYFGHTTLFYLRDYYRHAPFTIASRYLYALREQVALPHWSPHCLRTTYATKAAQLGIPPHIIERLLSHSAPEGKLHAIYNKHRYEKELREAAEKIEQHILDLVEP